MGFGLKFNITYACVIIYDMTYTKLDRKSTSPSSFRI